MSTALGFSGEPFPPESAPSMEHSGSPSLVFCAWLALETDPSILGGSCHSLPPQLVIPDQGSRTSPEEVKFLQPIRGGSAP